MPKKPIKRGYKIWMRCDESVFACQFEIYTGKLKDVEKNLGERVVKTLSKKLYGKNQTLHGQFFYIIRNIQIFRTSKYLLLRYCEPFTEKTFLKISQKIRK